MTKQGKRPRTQANADAEARYRDGKVSTLLWLYPEVKTEWKALAAKRQETMVETLGEAIKSLKRSAARNRP